MYCARSAYCHSSITDNMNAGAPTRTVFITGATGYIGTRLIKRLLRDRHSVIALVRKGSEHKVPEGAIIISGNPFDANSFQQHVPQNCVFVQLLGVAHPSPGKAQQFSEIDLKSVKASADAAAKAGAAHFVYISVAMSPSKLMFAYQQARKTGEQYCSDKKLNCSFIRPWYVLGPGHWWPVLLLPFYGLAEIVPSWRKQARARSLVTISQMLDTLVNVVQNDPMPLRVLEIKDIRSAANRAPIKKYAVETL